MIKNSDLPAPGEYYRLTRARELRAKAGRLEHCADSGVAPGLAVCVVCVPFLASFLVSICFGAVLGTVLAFGGFGLVVVAVWFLKSCAETLRSDADRLEADHDARFGALPPGNQLRDPAG